MPFPIEDTLAVTRSAAAANADYTREVLLVGGAGVVFCVTAGLRYLRRLVVEDDARQRELRAEHVRLHREIAELRGMLSGLQTQYAVCEAQREALAREVEGIKRKIGGERE
jgi:TolA-binding protein